MATLLDEKIIVDLESQRLELEGLIKESEDKGVENLDFQETEDYGFYMGKLSMINDMLGKYSQ
jgi:hypothetical protein